MYHPERVTDWKMGEDVAPIYVEISPTSSCNHKCSFCALDFARKNEMIDRDSLLKSLIDMGNFGVKSVMFGGEGEPTLHPSFGEFVKTAKFSGMDVAVTTNGTRPLNGLEHLSWIKISINGGTPDTYQKIHGCKLQDWNDVWSNVHDMVEQKKAFNLSTKIGVQSILLPSNQDTMMNLLERCISVGVDYLVIKPYSQHHSSINRQEIDYSVSPNLDALKDLAVSSKFELIYRDNAFSSIGRERDYDKCLSVPYFWAYIQSNGMVNGCSSFLGFPRFEYGNIGKQLFSDVWKGIYREHAKGYMSFGHNIETCRKACRMNKCNEYLWNVANDVEHKNFI
jgi:MoaA/NifB/PqqE/SkfB family radical SAM enzyme